VSRQGSASFLSPPDPIVDPPVLPPPGLLE
jgi:hypothetical protein